MLAITPNILIPDQELEWQFVPAGGPGGQHANRSATAVQLRFDYLASTALPDACKVRLLAATDRRVGKDGIILIRAQVHRSQDLNRQDALSRLTAIIQAALKVVRRRRPTRPGQAARQRRLADKARAGDKKRARRPVRPEGE
ncbi:MAG: alternative ribosome rescue aminoacyl-tRNA hydrolase ArfB [Thermodesulfobacteriota bacterium]